MITTEDNGHKVPEQIHDLLGDGLAFINEMERGVDYLLGKPQRAKEIDSLVSQAKSAYREMIGHARRTHQAMDMLTRTISEVENRTASY